MAGVKRNWRIWELPVGPEDTFERRSVFQAPKAETLTQYERLRQEGSGKLVGLVVTDEQGEPRFACS